MAELSTAERFALSMTSSNMMELFLLDDVWTEFAQRPVSPDDIHLGLISQMKILLEQMEAAADIIGELPELMGSDLQARFDALMWGDGLSTTDRDDLRWLVSRAGGVTGLVQSAASTLSNYQTEIDALDEQVGRYQSGETVAGDLSREFRCGLGCGLLVSGAAALPSAAGTAAAAAVAVGGAVAAGVIVGVSGGIGAIALVVAGILVMRRQKC